MVGPLVPLFEIKHQTSHGIMVWIAPFSGISIAPHHLSVWYTCLDRLPLLNVLSTCGEVAYLGVCCPERRPYIQMSSNVWSLGPSRNPRISLVGFSYQGSGSLESHSSQYLPCTRHTATNSLSRILSISCWHWSASWKLALTDPGWTFLPYFSSCMNSPLQRWFLDLLCGKLWTTS